MGYFSKLDLENQELGICQDEPEMDMDFCKKQNETSLKTKGNDMEIADAITEVAEELALVHYDKPLMELEEHERKEIILIAENEVLGI
jgi:hypothetical protein